METKLRTAFYDQIEVFGNERQIKIAHPNVSFDPNDPDCLTAADKHYLRTSIAPVPPEHINVNNDEARYLWTAQVSVYARDGIGELAPLRIAQELRAAYPRFYKFAGESLIFRVERTATIRPPVSSSSGWFFVPVQLRIQTII